MSDRGPATSGSSGRQSRRAFLRRSAFAAIGLSVVGRVTTPSAYASARAPAAFAARAAAVEDVQEASIADLQAAMAAGQMKARDLVLKYVERIATLDQAGPNVRSVIELNADALAIADALD